MATGGQKNNRKTTFFQKQKKQKTWNPDTTITEALEMPKREIKTIFFSVGTLSLIIEGEFLLKRDVSHLSLRWRRQVVPRHGMRWEHPRSSAPPTKTCWAPSSSRVPATMGSCATVTQSALAFSKYPFHRETGAEQHQRPGRRWPKRLQWFWDSFSGDHGARASWESPWQGV